tara:strand:- start:917 stop:1996 length:1080 start_codon:yes stop_codon:yes gene_type:complete
MNNWADELDDALVDKYQLKFTSIPASKQAYGFWLKGSVLNRLLSFLDYNFLSTKNLAFASNKRSWQLMQYLKKSTFEFEHIEAHTLGALYPAFHWAKKKGVTFSFDVEDFHPEEKITYQKIKERQRRYRLMKDLLPSAKYITAASPLIAQETEKLIERKVITINNVFPENEFKITSVSKENEKLKLIWFSQHISFGRGLEEFIEAAWRFKSQLSITLVGHLNSDFENRIIKPKQSFISTIDAMSQEDLHALLADFDVGLALENGNEDYNRQICLTNKIWAYFQAGLYILATSTKAQIEFIQQNPIHGQLITLEKENLMNGLQGVIDEKRSIVEDKEKRFTVAKKHSIENEMRQVKGLIL